MRWKPYTLVRGLHLYPAGATAPRFQAAVIDLDVEAANRAVRDCSVFIVPQVGWERAELIFLGPLRLRLLSESGHLCSCGFGLNLPVLKS